MAARDAAMLIDVARRRFTVEEFWRMAEAGLFLEQPRVELIDGEIIEMTPIGPRHGLCVGFLVEWLVPRLAGRAVAPAHRSRSASAPGPSASPISYSWLACPARPTGMGMPAP